MKSSLRWLSLSLAACAFAGLALARGAMPRSIDDAWLAHVAARVAGGEVLYRDTFCGVTPLAVVWQAFVQPAFGDPFLAFGLTLHLLFAWCLIGIAWAVRSGGGWTIAGAVAVFTTWVTPLGASPYTTWSAAFALASQLAASRCLESRRAVWFCLAGAFAGLTFASKQNMGLYVLVALATVWLVAIRDRRSVGLAIAGWVAAAGPWLFWIAATGGWPWFVAQGFVNKSVYLAQARLPYQAFIAWTWHGSLYLAPLLLAVLAGQWIFSRDRKLVVPLAFAAAGIAGIFPRPDYEHVFTMAVPLAVALGQLLALFPRPISAGFAIAAGIAASVHVVRMPVRARVDLQVAQRRVPLLEAHASPGILLVIPEAAAYYQAGAPPNPTRYDYPLTTAFGPHGQEEVIADIRAGRVRSVCARPDAPEWNRLAPLRLLRFVESEMHPTADLGFCRVYQAKRPQTLSQPLSAVENTAAKKPSPSSRPGNR